MDLLFQRVVFHDRQIIGVQFIELEKSTKIHTKYNNTNIVALGSLFLQLNFYIKIFFYKILFGYE